MTADQPPATLAAILRSGDMGLASQPGTLPAAIGQDDDGQGVVANLASASVVLVAGPDGSGKSSAVNAIVCSLLMSRTPSELNLLLFDPTGVELTQYRGIRHLAQPPITDAAEALRTLQRLERARRERLEMFRAAGVRDLAAYHERASRPRLPHLVFVGDEFETVLQQGSEAAELVVSVTRDAEAVGIHFVVSMPTEVASDLIRLIPHEWRHVIVFGRVTDDVLVRPPSDEPSRIPAHSLLYQAPRSREAVRLQGVQVSSSELQEILRRS
jgi:DNA segregation ATPase FtsK/SpoIIIE, S-DNA-T family